MAQAERAYQRQRAQSKKARAEAFRQAHRAGLSLTGRSRRLLACRISGVGQIVARSTATLGAAK